MMFILHWESKGKPNTQFRMQESVLQQFDTMGEEFNFVNTVSENKESFTAIQIKGAEAARDLYTMLVYPPTKYYK